MTWGFYFWDSPCGAGHQVVRKANVDAEHLCVVCWEISTLWTNTSAQLHFTLTPQTLQKSVREWYSPGEKRIKTVLQLLKLVLMVSKENGAPLNNTYSSLQPSAKEIKVEERIIYDLGKS